MSSTFLTAVLLASAFGAAPPAEAPKKDPALHTAEILINRPFKDPEPGKSKTRTAAPAPLARPQPPAPATPPRPASPSASASDPAPGGIDVPGLVPKDLV